MDEREFRKLIYAILHRLVDDDESNDNDIIAKMDDFTYLVSTYLNTDITIEILNDCFKDIEKNNATFGLLFTNTIVTEEITDKAKKMNIEIIDRDKLMYVI